jgi:hypothetical protein
MRHTGHRGIVGEHKEMQGTWGNTEDYTETRRHISETLPSESSTSFLLEYKLPGGNPSFLPRFFNPDIEFHPRKQKQPNQEGNSQTQWNVTSSISQVGRK